MGGSIQHFLHPRIFFVGSFLLPLTTVQINLFSDIQAEGTEGETKIRYRNPDPTREGRSGVIAGD